MFVSYLIRFFLPNTRNYISQVTTLKSSYNKQKNLNPISPRATMLSSARLKGLDEAGKTRLEIRAAEMVDWENILSHYHTDAAAIPKRLWLGDNSNELRNWQRRNYREQRGRKKKEKKIQTEVYAIVRSWNNGHGCLDRNSLFNFEINNRSFVTKNGSICFYIVIYGVYWPSALYEVENVISLLKILILPLNFCLPEADKLIYRVPN